MSYVDRNLISDKRKRCDELGFAGEDRRVPFGQHEIAGLAGDNISESGVDIADVTDLTTDLIRSFGKKRSANIWQKTQRLARKIRRRQLCSAASSSVPWDRNVLTLTAYLEAQLSPAGDRNVIYQLPSTLGLKTPTCCAAEIYKLPARLREPLVKLDISSLKKAWRGPSSTPARSNRFSRQFGNTV